MTGRDLVADQLAIAEGRPLSIQPKAAAGLEAGAGIPAVGHAVEVRLYAEDAEAGFLPATGAIEALRWPTGEGIRVDAGIALGDTVGGRFDPMLAKIVAWGPDRNTALARLARALDDTVVLGLVTNLRFLRWLVRQPVVLAGGARTDTLDRIWPPDDWTVRATIPDEAWAAAAAALTGETARDDGDPWAGGWRLNGPASIRLEAEGLARLVVGAWGAGAASASGAWGASDSTPPALVRVGDTVHLDIAGRSVAFRLALPPDVDIAARAAAGRHTGVLATGPIELRAPMPGAIVAIHAVPGAAIEAGGPVVTIEAMKMEHIVTAPGPGRLAELHVQQGEQVIRGQLLAVIEP